MASSHLVADQSAQDAYLRLYIVCDHKNPDRDPDDLEKNKDYLGELAYYRIDVAYLQKMQELYPNWEQVLLSNKIKQCQGKIIELQPLATKQYDDLYTGVLATSGPPISPLLHDGDNLEKSRDYWGALNRYEKGLIMLEIIHSIDPKWESALVNEKTKQTKSAIDRLETALVLGK